MGLMHHLDDSEVTALAKLANIALKPTGKFITIDPSFSPDQNIFARYLITKDRGQNVRDEKGYVDLLSKRFIIVNSLIRHQFFIPYTHCIITSDNMSTK